MPINAISIILGGGRGQRLLPLTEARAKPAVPFAGQYRLVDVPISNSLHAGIQRIYVLTQYMAASLNRHVAQTYRFDAFSTGHVTVLAAEQTPQGCADSDWYKGTADAVRKMLHRFDMRDEDDVFILSGDQIYLMDLQDMLQTHRQMKADVTVAATPVARDDARRYGVMRVDTEGWISEFAEKPQDEETITKFVVPGATSPETHLASMGIYVFKASVLRELLADPARTDFGKHVLPVALTKASLLSYSFSGFWEDVGTLESYHRINLELTEPVPGINLFDERVAIYTRPRFLPPAKLGSADVSRALVCAGAIVNDGARIRDSVIGIRTVVGPRCELSRVVVSGAGAYDLDCDDARIPLGIGADSVLHNAVLDRDVRIGRGVRLVNTRGLRDYNDDYIAVRDGIIVVGARGEVPDGYSF